MEAYEFLAIGLVVIAFGLISGRVEGTPVTPPMVFIATGVVFGALGLLDVGIEEPLVAGIMEVTLVVVLFTDASRIDLGALRREFAWPARMLGVGLPMTVVVGTGLALLLLPGLSFWEAAVLGVALAPTDATLGQAVVSDDGVPRWVRQTINVESGLNDGLALPLLTITLALAAAMRSAESAGYWATLLAREIGVALVVGAGLAWIVGRLIVASRSRGWMTAVYVRLTGVALALVAFGVVEVLNGSGFIAAFVAGAVLGNVAREECSLIHTFAEAEGQQLVLITFLLFGAIGVTDAFGRIDWRVALYGVGSLTVARFAGVGLSLVGSGLRAGTVWFVSWFGPRGLASLIFGLLILEAPGVEGADRIFDVIVVTVVASTLLHGITAAPLARRYSQYVSTRETPGMLEMAEVSEMPYRHGGRRG